MRRATRFVAAMLAAVGFAGALVVGATAPAGAADGALEADFVARLNGVRAGVGVAPLAVDAELTAVARAWSDHMAAVGAISHNPNVGAQVTAPWRTVGENVGVGPEVGAVMQAFVASASHYQNIVDPSFDRVGVGVSWGADGRLYTTHVFMDLGATVPTPAASPAAPTAAPSTVTPAPDPSSLAAVPAAAPIAPPPAAFAPERVAAMLALVGALDDGVR